VTILSPSPIAIAVLSLGVASCVTERASGEQRRVALTQQAAETVRIVHCAELSGGCCKKSERLSPTGLVEMAAGALTRAAFAGEVLMDKVRREMVAKGAEVHLVSEHSFFDLKSAGLVGIKSRNEIERIARETGSSVYYLDLYISRRSTVKNDPAVGISGRWGVLRYVRGGELRDEFASYASFCFFGERDAFTLGLEGLGVLD
jgi:hypothetical protein